jgi:hypothetical protein
MRHILATLVAALVAGLPALAAPDTDALCRSAMAPYYAALLASARGDAEGTLRHLILLEAQWDAVTRRSGPDAPEWLRDATAGRPVGMTVAATIGSARRHLPLDVSGAHAELEGIRALLRDARTRHGARTADDAVTDYHEAMERLSSHIGLSNEITLTPKDFTAIGLDVGRARLAWAKVELFPELAGPSSGWSAGATARVLGTIAEAAERRDATAVQQASRTLKSRYFDLLSVLSRRQ